MQQVQHMVTFWLAAAAEALADHNPEVRACYANLVGLAMDYHECMTYGDPLPSYLQTHS